MLITQPDDMFLRMNIIVSRQVGLGSGNGIIAKFYDPIVLRTLDN